MTEIQIDIDTDEILKDVEEMTTPVAPTPVEAGKYEITAQEIMQKEIKIKSNLVVPILPSVGVVSLAGSSDTGKSCLLRQLAVSIVQGDSDFIQFKINPKHKSVIFVASEDNEEDTSILLHKHALKCAPEQLQGLRFIFEIDNLLEKLNDSLENKSADLVIIDCFADIFAGDLKNTSDIRACLHKYKELSERHKCLIIFLHHTGKRTENKEPNKNNLLSGQGFEGKMRLVIELRADLNNANIRHLCIVKGNYLPAKFKNQSFELYFDENSLTFTSTGNRIPFEQLAKKEDDEGKAKYLEAVRLKAEGKTHDEIAEAFGYDGEQRRAIISKLITKGNKNGWNNEAYITD